MNINQLKYFIAVAEHHSFTKAAIQYYLTQTAITQQIRSLEETIGTELFDRSTRPISLTPAGNVFLNEAKAIVERMNTALTRTIEASTGLVGSLRIGYTKGYERSNLSDKLRSFHRSFPNILLTCYRADSDALAAGLLNNEYDIIFTWDSTNLCSDERTAHCLIEQARLVVALYSAHPYAQRSCLHRQELKNEKILYMSPSGSEESFGDAHFLQLYQKCGYQPNILLRSADIESILMMVAAEEGVSILPSYSTNKLTNADNLIFIPLIGDEEVENIHAIWRKDGQSQALMHFISHSFMQPAAKNQ